MTDKNVNDYEYVVRDSGIITAKDYCKRILLIGNFLTIKFLF